MPYDVVKTSACPINRPYGVVKQGTATPLGCHASESEASDQVQALYASEDIARAKYDGIDFKPSKGAQAEAEKGLEWRREYNRGGTLVGVARARDIANGKDLSPETIGRMVSYFSRHEVDKKGQGWRPGEPGFPSAGRIAWALWGGDAGRSWANNIKRQMDNKDKVERMSKTPTTIQRAFGQIKDGRAVIATETPVAVWDAERRQMVNQVLLMDGVQFRNAKRQLPIVDSHNDKTVRNVFGSIRNIEIQGDQLVGDPQFATDEESQIVRTRYDEGHLNDFSIDATILARTYVPQGQQYTTKRGVVIDGPAEIVTAWEPHNASICATGADPNSTVRRSLDQEIERIAMDEALMAQASALGLPEGVTDPNQVVAFLLGKAQAMQSEESGEQSPAGEVEMMAGQDKPAEDAMRADPAVEAVAANETKVADEVARQIKAIDDRRKAIYSAAELAKVERSFADQLVDSGCSVQDAQERIIRKMSNQPIGTSVVVTESEQDKFEEAAKAGLVQRCFRGQVNQKAPQAEGAAEFANLGLYRLAEACVRRMGINPEKYSKADVAKIAQGHRPTIDRLRVQRANEAYNTTGTFANILLDAANKTLRAAYEEAPFTWNLWCRQAQSVEDFKQINRIQLSEFGNLEMVPETKPFPQKSLSDRKKSYVIEKFGAEFTISWETIINDDLDALSRIPAMQGVAARRTQEKLVYDTLVSNPTMPDAYSLFSASHASGSNVSGSAAAPSVSTLNDGFKAMALQKGLGGAILNLVPKILLVPQAYAATALELVNSSSYAVTNGNQGIVNIYGTNGVRPLQVVATGLLDANSTTNWYLIADNSQVDTMELTFLSGEEAPVTESEYNMSNATYKYVVRQSFGCAAIDHVGFYGNR